MDGSLTTEEFIALTASIRNEDQRQDTIAALLEAMPATEAEARKIIDRARYANENRRAADRKRLEPIEDEIALEDAPRNALGAAYEAVCRLPEKQRTTILLRVLYDYSVEEIGQRMGVSRVTICRWTKSALTTLRATVTQPIVSQLSL